MANMQKYNMREAMAVIMHVERTGASHSNQNIYMEYTEDNYALWPPDSPDELKFDTGVTGQSSARYAYKRLKKRLSEVECLQRDDVNVLIEIDLHVGVDVPPGYDSEREFYEAAVRVFSAEYGAENVVYAWVHNDETGSHLHFGFVPVVKKVRKLRKNASERLKQEYEEMKAAGNLVYEKVDANSIMTRRYLQNWHPWMSKRLTDELGYNPGVHTGITQFLGGNVTVKQLYKKPRNWTEQRDRKAEAFHDARRAALSGSTTNIDSLITLTDKTKPQAESNNDDRRAGRKGFDSMLKNADDRKIK